MELSKITDKNIAFYFGVTPQTIVAYKKGSQEKQRLYLAMRKYYKEQK